MAYFKKEWKTWPQNVSRKKLFEESERYKELQRSEEYQEMIRNNQLPRYRPSFTNFDFVEWKGRRGHESFLPIAGMPISGIEQIAEASVRGVDTAAFRLVTPSGEEIRPLDLRHPSINSRSSL